MSTTPNYVRTTQGTSRYDYIVYNAQGIVTGQASGLSLALSTWFEDVRQVVSTSTPNFRSLKKSQLPVNEYYKYEERYTGPGGNLAQRADYLDGTSVHYVYRANYTGLIGDNFGRVAATEADDLTQRLVGKLISEIGTANASTGVTVWEGSKTATHVAKTATRIYKALDGLRRGRFGDFATALGITYTSRQSKSYGKRYNRAKSFDAQEHRYSPTRRFSSERHNSRVTDLVSDTWLEYSYGWKPLLKDVDDHAKALANLLVEKQMVVRTCTVSAKSTKVLKSSRVSGQLTYNEQSSSTKWGRMQVKFSIPAGGVPISDVLGLSNPLYILWDKVPFSFVADWFLPIGTFLESLTAFNGLVFHSGWVAHRHVYGRSRQLLPAAPYVDSGGTKYSVVGCNIRDQFDEVGMTRSKLVTFPAFGFPEFKDPRSFAHAASAIALLQSLFLRK